MVKDESQTSTPSLREKTLLRELAGRLAEAAASPEMERVRRRWRDVNEFRVPDRPPVWCKPVGCWGEILPPERLVCEHPEARSMECHFRQILAKLDIGDDTIVNPFYSVPVVVEATPANLWGVEIKHQESDADGGAWAYDPPIKTAADLDKLAKPSFRIDREATERGAARAREILGDVVPVTVTCGGAFAMGGLSATLGYFVSDLLGLSEMMMLMAMDPDMVHQVTARVRDAVLDCLAVLEEGGVLTANNDAHMTCSDDFGPAPVDGRLTLRNLWCAANSQEYDQVSPEMWEEFCLNYQKTIFAKFGRIAYGCCENLTHKIDGVLSVPNLRVFVCSAWTDLDLVIDKVGADKTIMWRQKASDVVFPDDLAPIEKDLREGISKLKGCRYQIVLRELQTLMGHPDRLKDWTRLAKDIAASVG